MCLELADGACWRYAEIDRRPVPDVAIAYFGLMPQFIGHSQNNLKDQPVSFFFALTMLAVMGGLLPESTAIHWHGQPIQLGMDGVPDISRPAIAAGQEFIYDLNNLIPGTYWFHPHGHEMQLDVGLASVLIVDPANPDNNVTARIEPGERDAFVTAANEALVTITVAQGLPGRGETIAAWKELFGENFSID